MATPDLIRPDFAPKPGSACFCHSGEPFADCCGSPEIDRPPPHGVGIASAFLDSGTCEKWLNRLRRQPVMPLGTIETPERGVSHSETTHAGDRITDLVKAGRLRAEINRQIERAFQTVIAPTCERRFAWFEYPQVLRYPTGGWYLAHADSEIPLGDGRVWAKGIDRDISVLLYLNDDFEGGQLSFVHFNYTYQPQAGDLVFFPSDHRYAHQAEPVERGVRWVVASWAAFADQPRVHDQPAPASILL